MAKKGKPVSGNGGPRGLRPEELKKLGGGLRRLLAQTDDEIAERHEVELKRHRERLAELDQLAERVPPRASDTDREAVRRVRRINRAALVPRRELQLVQIGPIGPVRVRAITRFNGNRSDLEALGIQVRSQAHDIFTIVATLDQIARLAAQPATRRIQLPRLMMPSLDEAAVQSETRAVHQARPANPNGFTGNGVVVGQVDSALDITHNAFRDPAGTNDTRVAFYWVQDPWVLNAAGNVANPPANLAGVTPEQFWQADPANSPNFNGLDYGRLYTGADIDTALGLAGQPFGSGNNEICAEPTSNDEHGTHVAGISAGSGHVANWATAQTHVGAAPEATIVHVCYRWSLDNAHSGVFEDDVIDALDFIFRAADFLNVPASVNASLGTSLGPHDGASLFDVDRDNLINSFAWRSVTWAAGNDNNDNGYRAGTINAGANTSITLTPSWMWTTGVGTEGPLDRWLDVWYTGPEVSFEVSCGGVPSGTITAGNDYNGTLNGFDIDVERDPEQSDGRRGLRLRVEDALSTSPVRVTLSNPHASQTVQYQCWVGAQGHWGSVDSANQGKHTLSDTGCGKAVLTVGACDKRFPANPAQAETISAYSGRGPTADGRIKPEIAAVGTSVRSTASDRASGYVDMTGTSMAAPLVAGSVALLFEAYDQQNLELDQDEVKALLIEHANRAGLDIDPDAAGYDAAERDAYGYGRLRMIGPIDHAWPPLDVDVWLRTADDDYGNEPYPGGTFWRAPDIEIFAAGSTTATTQLTWGTTYSVQVRVRNLGDQDAVNTEVRIYYTLPGAAPNDWVPAQDASDQDQIQTVTVPALDEVVVTFEFRPEQAEVGGSSGQTHYCMLGTVHHAVGDPLTFPHPASGTHDAWRANIRSTNNVALRNLHIQ